MKISISKKDIPLFLKMIGIKRMKSTVTLYIARHGKTVFNSLGKVQGWCDSPLTEEGEAVAHNLGKGLREVNFSAVYISDLNRTRQTANILLKSQGQIDLNINELEGLKEASFGSFESGYSTDLWGLIVAHLGYKDLEGESLKNLRKSVDARKTLDTSKLLDEKGTAEGFEDVEKRAHQALDFIVKKEMREGEAVNVLVISHVMAIRVMLDKFGGEQLLTEDYIDNASVSKLVYKAEGYNLQSIGDLSYVRRGEQL